MCHEVAMAPKQTPNSPPLAKDDPLVQIAKIERDQAVLWTEVLCVTVAMPLVLGSAAFILRRFGASVAWPWPHTDLLLLAALDIFALAFAIYSTHRYRVGRARRDVLVRGQRQRLNELQRCYDQLIKLNKVSRTLASRTTPQGLFNRITQICFDTFDCERVSVMTVDLEKRELMVRSAVGQGNLEKVLAARQGVGDGVAGWVAEHRKPLLLGRQVNPSKFWRFRPRAEEIYAAMLVPMVFREQLYGVLCVSSRNQDTVYSQKDLRVLEVMAWTAAVCVRHGSSWGNPASERGGRNPSNGPPEPHVAGATGPF
jgi:hypothetical protein